VISMTTRVYVKNITGKAITDFMLNCTDEQYQNWWKGTHFAFHTLRRYPDNIGNTVIFDEMVGKHRLRFTGIVTEIIPGRKLVWQMTKWLKLPGWLMLEFEDGQTGVEILHTVKVGYQGIGRILDPLIKFYLSKNFEKDLNEHAQIEFQKLAILLA